MNEATPGSKADFDGWTILDSVTEGVMITDAHLERPGPTVLYVNSAFERMTGWSKSEIIGRSPRLLQGEATDHTVFQSLHPTLIAGRVWKGRTINYRRTGEPFLLEWSISPAMGFDGRISHYVAVQRDVTQDVALEQAGAAAVAAKDDFLAMMTHELRMPLSIIIGYADLMSEIGDKQADRIDHYATVVRQNAISLMETVEGILDHARTGKGLVDLTLVDVDLRLILEDCLEMVRPNAETRGVTFSFEPGQPEMVIGDELRLRQIFSNILGNAIKHGRDRGHVAISLTGDESGATIVISDDGPGIPDEMRERVFEPFVQAHPHLSRVARGVGLGLTIVQRFVQLHGGAVEILPGAGIGAKFKLWFPRKSTSAGVL